MLTATERQCQWQRFSAFGRIEAHRHLTSYATLVLAGNYQEAGESGRWQIRPGMLVVHEAGEAHADWFGGHTTELISFELRQSLPAGAYCCAHPEALAKRVLAGVELSLPQSSLEPVAGEQDWPDLLATTLRRNPAAAIATWAAAHGLRPESVSRGFSRAYGVTPAAYRLGVRVKGALNSLRAGNRPLVEVALDHGFADQSHMTRALRAQVGRTPGQLRQVNSVQEGSFGLD